MEQIPIIFEDAHGKFEINCEGYLDFRVNVMWSIREVPDFTPVSFKNKDGQTINGYVQYDDNEKKYVIVSQDSVVDLDYDTTYTIKYYIIAMLDAHRYDCRWRDKIAYDNGVSVKTQNWYNDKYVRQVIAEGGKPMS